MVEQNETRETLRQIVFNLTSDQALREDLTQEALVHLWLRQQERPGQTRSWYFQSCDLFLRNYLRIGRSVDSLRHRATLCRSALPVDEDPETASEDGTLTCEPVLGVVSAREILAMVAKWLTPLERQILSLLDEGRHLREIAAQLNVSHSSILRHRRRIAELALRAGVEPLPAGKKMRAQGSV